MIRNHYLIEFRFHGHAKKYLKKLIFEVSKRFRVKGVTRKRVVPHITLFGPFSTKYEKKMVSEVVSAIENYNLVPFKLKGFGHFGKKVIYVDVEPSEELKKLRRDIAQRLLSISRTQEFDSAHDFLFHGTIAFKDIEQKFDSTWNFLKEKEESEINQYLLRVSIIKNQRILYEYDLMQRKLLNRRQALSKNLWKKTIEILKKELPAMEGICDYHLCQKRTKVYKCKYCDGYFCKEHLQPKLPGPPYYGTTRKEKDLMLEYQKPTEGHPCAPYIDVWRVEQERKKREQYEALDRFIRSKPLRVKTPTPEPLSWMDRIKPKESTVEQPIEKFERMPKPIKVERKKDSSKIIMIGIIFLLIITSILIFKDEISPFLFPLNCSDGTFYNHCSENKPYYCLNGTLLEKASICGCPYDYKIKNESCEKIVRCKDGTISGECSSTKPWFCKDGNLINKASLCGCPTNEVPQGEVCISKFEVGPKEQNLQYVLRGVTKNITFTVYSGLNDHLAGLSRYYYCDPECPSDRELQLRYLDQKEQKEYLAILGEKIKSETNEKDDQVRIAISLVQKIPYDWAGFETGILSDRYPYEVVYDNKGVCGEKSRLLAFLLRELGFDIVLFNFKTEQHMAVGIKCPEKYSYEGTGYCFIETARPAIITDDQEDYVGVGQLTSTPQIIHISDGISFDSVSEEYEDAQEWIRINKLSESTGRVLDIYNYNMWLSLVIKYGVELSK